MARHKLWSALSRQHRDRAAQLAEQYGLSRRQARERYNRGTFTPFARDKVPFKTKPRFIPKPVKVPPSKPTSAPGSFDNDKQRRVFNRIMSWFPGDGYYLVNGKRYYPSQGQSPSFRTMREASYHTSQGVSWHPANPLNVYVRAVSFTNRELDAILGMTREDFQSVASGNFKFWYH